MLRTSMATLVSRVRLLIGDPSPSAQPSQFSDLAIQDALDHLRSEMRAVALRPQPTWLPGATVVYLDYYSDARDWEDDWKAQDMSWATVNSLVLLAEPLVGHWQFSTQPNGIGVRITGKTYDVYGSAADLLESWAASLARLYDYQTDGQRFLLSQQAKALLTQAAEYRKRAQPHMMRMVQSDANPDFDGGGVVYPNIGGQGGYS